MVRPIVASGRTLASSLLDDTGIVERPSTDPPTIDPVTYVSTPAAPTTVYEGPCRVRTPTNAEQIAIFGEVAVNKQRFLVSFAYDVPLVNIGDVVRITDSEDPHVSVRSFRVVAVPSKTHLMYRQFGVEVTS
jgi:hypothetical protein